MGKSSPFDPDEFLQSFEEVKPLVDRPVSVEAACSCGRLVFRGVLRHGEGRTRVCAACGRRVFVSLGVDADRRLVVLRDVSAEPVADPGDPLWRGLDR